MDRKAYQIEKLKKIELTDSRKVETIFAFEDAAIDLYLTEEKLFINLIVFVSSHSRDQGEAEGHQDREA